MKKFALIFVFTIGAVAVGHDLGLSPPEVVSPRPESIFRNNEAPLFPKTLPRIDGHQAVFHWQQPVVQGPQPVFPEQQHNIQMQLPYHKIPQGFPGYRPCGNVPPNPGWQIPCEPVTPMTRSVETIEVNPITEVTFVAPLLDNSQHCPSGTNQKGNECVTIHFPNCPQGYVWNNERCVSTQTSCPLDYDWDGRSCVQRKICPNNHIFKNDRCVLPTPVCRPGWNWNGIVCNNNEIYCQPGSVRKGDECVTERFICPSGYTEGINGCTKLPVQCSPGYELSVSGFCITRTARCPQGSKMVEGRCRTLTVSCPEGSYKEGERCYRKIGTNTKTVRCPEGFTLKNNLCYKCAPQYNLCNSHCVHKSSSCVESHQPSQPSNPMNINVNLHTSNHGSSQPSSGKGHNIVNNIAGHNNTIVNVNNITNPVTLNNVNENNINVYTSTQCRDGSIRTVMVKNNETINGCVDVETGVTTDESDSKEKVVNSGKCCEIIAPRQCKQRNNGQWGCAHKRFKYCGKFCIADRLYLKPPSTTYNNNVLTFAPPQSTVTSSTCAGRQCPPIDCGGCTNGSWNCSPQCYTNQCSNGGCNYLYQSDFCGTVGGNICSE